jgi:predicted nucleic acid-binding protein
VNVVDSSAWLEYFANGPNAGYFAPAIENTAELLVPSIALHEVTKRILLLRGEGPALEAAAALHAGQLVDLDANLALGAARLSVATRLPMADGIVLATARRFDALVWTQDADFEGQPHVRYRARRT